MPYEPIRILYGAFLPDAFPIAFIITKGFLTTTRTTRTTLIKYFKNSTYGLMDDGDKGKRLYLGRRVEPAKSSRCAGVEPALKAALT